MAHADGLWFEPNKFLFKSQVLTKVELKVVHFRL